MCDFPKEHETVDLTIWTITAFANHTLYKKISCSPLSDSAAKSFLKIVFLPVIFKEEGRQCDSALVESFKQKLLELPLAWTEKDQSFLSILLNKCVLHLQQEFGHLDLKDEVDWRFVNGFCIAKIPSPLN